MSDAPPPPAALRIRLDAPAEVRAGDAVPFTLRVENAGARPLELYLRGRAIAFDVVVARPDGLTMWRRLGGEVVQAILQIRVLAPGEVLELRAAWDQRDGRGAPVGPGDYRAHGVLLMESPERVSTAPVPLRIVRR